jgi:hypothetical protein
MDRTPDDATRLMNLLVAIWGAEINSYWPKIEALVATLDANARFVKTGQESGQKERRVSRWSLLCWEPGEALAPIGRKRNCQRLTARATRLRR